MGLITAKNQFIPQKWPVSAFGYGEERLLAGNSRSGVLAK